VVFETIDTKLKERKAQKMETLNLSQEVHA
jgi:hypothetical protein